MVKKWEDAAFVAAMGIESFELLKAFMKLF